MKYLTSCSGRHCCNVPHMRETPESDRVYLRQFCFRLGPRPAIEKAFEEVCDCDLKFVGTGDGAALLARVKLEGARSDADVVLGLDTNLTAAATATGLFAPHSVDVRI